MTVRSPFHGLSAFPLTPADAEGVVDTGTLGILVDRLVAAGVDSIGLLGSTGIYAYLGREQRARAAAAAVEAAAGRVPVIVGVGALRTAWAIQHAVDAADAGADALLLAPMSYTPLGDDEVAAHCRAVAGATGLPLCLYNNPGTTHFSFSDALIAQLSKVPQVDAIKMPLPADGDFAAGIGRLRSACSPDFAIGYSGDWGAAAALLAGADAWYSVIAGLLPVPALHLTRAGRAGDATAVAALDAAFAPLWALFRDHGSLRVMYAVADLLGLKAGAPPLPIRALPALLADDVAQALEALESLPA